MSGDEEAKLYNSGLIEPENEPRDDEDTTHFLRDDDLEELDEAEREFFSGNGLDDGEDKDKPAAEPGEISERSKRDLFAINNYISVALETFLRKNHGQIFSGGWLDRSRLLHGSPEKRIVEYVTEEMPHSSNADFTLKETKLAGSVAREIYEVLLKPNDADDRAALDHLATGIRGNLSKVIEDNVHSYFGRMTEEPENRSAAFNALAKELDRNYVSANGEGLKRKNVAGLFAYVPAEDVAEEKVSAEEKKPADEVPEDKKDVSAPENKEDLRAVEAICIMGALKKFMDEHKQSIYEGSWVDRNVFVSKTPVQYLGDFVREEFKGSSDAREFSERELNLITDAVRDLYETRLKPKDADDRQALMDLSQGIGGTLDTVINDNVSRYFLEGHHFPDKMPKPYRRLLDEFQGKKPGRGKRFAAALGGALAIGIVGGVVAANVEHCAGLDCRSASTAADAAPYFAELDADVDAAPAPIVADAEIVHDAEAAEAADADRDSEPETPMVPWEPAGPMTYDDNQLPKLPFGPEPYNFVRFEYD
ncbi:hypothetical protein KY359_04540 [Candidatus Woesearchaeota archaeon]|nr:hypothetical protein [Candidatus Woesearchaeota archaeon]